MQNSGNCSILKLRIYVHLIGGKFTVIKFFVNCNAKLGKWPVLWWWQESRINDGMIYGSCKQVTTLLRLVALNTWPRFVYDEYSVTFVSKHPTELEVSSFRVKW